MVNIVLSTNADPMAVASNAKDMLSYIESKTTDPDQQERLMNCAIQYKRTTRRFCLPVILNMDRKDNESFYFLDFEKIDIMMARYINEYFEKLRNGN